VTPSNGGRSVMALASQRASSVGRVQPPNQALHLAGAAILVSRGRKVLKRPGQVSWFVGPQ
jgi:hypothetical protein